MKVTIIGAGNMGRGIGMRAVAGGNDVEIVDRDPGEARALAEELQGAATGGASATAVEPGGALGGEVVVLAVYFPSEAEIVRQYRDQLAGKVVVEISLPLDWETYDRLIVPDDSSAAEETAKLLPSGTPVVKAFTTNFAGTLAAGEAHGQRLDALVAGDDAEAKAKVAALVEGGGMRALDVGPLRRARQMEHAGFLQAVLQQPMEWGFGSALKFHPDDAA